MSPNVQGDVHECQWKEEITIVKCVLCEGIYPATFKAVRFTK